MDRVHIELIPAYHQADLQREADAARRLPVAARRSFSPSLLLTVPLAGLGRALIAAGTWLQRLDRACPTCPAPAN